MAETVAFAGPGFLLDYEDPDVPGSFIHVLQCRDIDGPNETTDVIDITNQDSEGGFKEFLPTLQDGGTVTVEVVGDPAQATQRDVADLKHNRVRTRWRIRYPEDSGSTWVTVFPAIVTGWGFRYPYAGLFTRNLTLRVVGPIEEVAPGSGSGS